MYKSNVSIRVQFFDNISKQSLFWKEISKINKTSEEIKYINKHESVENNSIFNGVEDLSLKDDFAKIYLYQTSNIISLREKSFRVVKRDFQADYPLMLNMYVEQID